MGWVREVILNGYRNFKGLKYGEGRYGSFSVTIEKLPCRGHGKVSLDF
jgi:hypothetical protein